MKKLVTIKNKKQTNKGITLIALVITIIVLLILAGVSIATLTGQNGILNQATGAKDANNKATALEKVQTEVMGSYGQDGTIDIPTLNTNLNQIKGIQGTPITKLPATVTVDGYEIEIKANGEVTIKGESSGEETGNTEVDGVPIPEGFYHVAGTTKAEGLVISDVQGDDINNTKQGNQFVWVPVEEYSEFIRREGYFNGSLQTYLADCGEADATGKNSKVTESATTQQEAKDMYKSVSTNKGFYIGRYEAGKDANGNVICQKGATVYNNIKWGNSMLDDTGGAVEKARNFATEKGYTGVTSTLCYGVQWDSALKFMDPTWDGYTKDSTGKGHYDSDSPIATGSNDDYKVKNIYDMAGNVDEWTMESYDATSRMYRGGSYVNTGFYLPSSFRNSDNPILSYSYVGFRLTLFV